MKYRTSHIGAEGGCIREVLIALGLAIMLGAGSVVLWSSFQIRNLERAQDIGDEWGLWYPYDDILDDEFERQRDFYSAVRILGAIGLMVGLIMVLYGFLLMKKKPEPVAVVAQAPSTVVGATNFCEFCGRQISPGAARCPGCGRALLHEGYEGDREQEVR